MSVLFSGGAGVRRRRSQGSGAGVSSFSDPQAGPGAGPVSVLFSGTEPVSGRLEGQPRFIFSGGRRLDQTGATRPAPLPPAGARSPDLGDIARVWPDVRSRPGGRRRPGPNGHGGVSRPAASPAGSDSWSSPVIDRSRSGDATTFLGLRHALISGHDVFVAASPARVLRRPPAAGRVVCCSRCCARTENADRSHRSSAGGPEGYP